MARPLLLHVLFVASVILTPGVALPGRDQEGNATRAKLSDELLNARESIDEEIDVIVQHAETNAERRAARSRLSGRRVVREFQELPVSVVRVRRSELGTLAADPDVLFVSPDYEVRALNFPPWMLKEAIGYRFAAMTVPERPVEKGTGIGIAILDSGVSNDAYFLNGASGCTASRIVYSQNFVQGESTTDDLYGHGTHVAGIAAGDGRCLPGAYVDISGIAPEAKIVNLRVLNSRGAGTDSAVIAAIDRAIHLKSTYKIRVMNLSLGRVVKESFSKDPLNLAVQKAWKAGILVTVAGGNNGRDNSMQTGGYSTITAPGNDPYVLTVGSTRMVGHTGRGDDTVTSYSSKGPTLLDQVVKPDIVAPGNIVFARMSPQAYLAATYQANLVGVSMGMGPNVPNIFLLSGTSMAAPVAGGSAALLLEKDSTLTPDQIKARLMNTAWKSFVPAATITDPVTYESFFVKHDVFTVGAGLLDLKSALASTSKPSSTLRALSPRVVYSNGTVTMTTTYPSIKGVGVVWGTGVTWGTGVVWGTTQFLGTSNNLMGSGVVWGTNGPEDGFGVVWGTGIVWGTANPFSEALAIRGDRQPW